VRDDRDDQHTRLHVRVHRPEYIIAVLALRTEAAEPTTLCEEVARHHRVVEETAAGVRESEEAIARIRTELEASLEEHGELGRERHSGAARLNSLREIQAAALGGDDEDFRAWLDGHDLDGAPQLVSLV